ncbi:hypothetical protein [Mucilaginibacter terrae]|uniref:Septum formation inhibitor Maf n=1 Tax=Mucilaginibacter terrae TaxID=1955052 RepID=A0ABU3GPC2_9SPHI|nr:hypothetical protein [Mucilaginibacter terrae]MDT3401639.1 hypothetical protein [Mucilaginibacter terrae]
MYTLITAASSARAYQLKNQLALPNVLLGDFEDLPQVMLKAGTMIKLPPPSSETYPHQMLALCLDHGIDTVYLLHAEEMNALAPATLLFDEYGITLNAPHD